MRLPIRLLLLVPLLAPGGAAAQGLYKWVDESGKVTYSDQPPVGKVRSKEVITIPGSTNPGAARQLIDQDTQFKKRQDDAAKAQATATKKEELEKQKADNCTRARTELRALRDNTPMAKLNEKGERVMLEGAARDAESKRMETFVEENCAQIG